MACFSVVHGDKETVDAMLHHPDISAVSFVGSTPIARYIYETAATTREALPGAGRRQEPHDRHARRRPRPGGRRSDGRCLWFCRRALHGDLGRGAGRRNDCGHADLSGWSQDSQPQDRTWYGPEAEMGPLIRASIWTRSRGYIDQGVAEGAKLRRRRSWLQDAGLRGRLFHRRIACSTRSPRT